MKIYVSNLGVLEVPDAKVVERPKAAASTSHLASHAHQARNSFGPEPSRSSRGGQGAQDDEPASRNGLRVINGDAIQDGSDQVTANDGIGALQQQQAAVTQIGSLVDKAGQLASDAAAAATPVEQARHAADFQKVVSQIDASAGSVGLGSSQSSTATATTPGAVDGSALGLSKLNLTQPNGPQEALRTVEVAKVQVARAQGVIDSGLRAHATANPLVAEQAARSAAEATRRQPDAASTAQANVTLGDVAALLA